MLAPQPITYVTKDGTVKTHEPSPIRMSAFDVARLARKADEEEVQVFVDFDMQEFVATSGSERGKVYHVHFGSCECKGFLFRGRCKHTAKLVRDYHKLL